MIISEMDFPAEEIYRLADGVISSTAVAEKLPSKQNQFASLGSMRTDDEARRMMDDADRGRIPVKILDLPDELLRETSYYMSVSDCRAFALSHERFASLFDEAYWRARVKRSLLNANAQYPPLDPVMLSSAASSRATSNSVSRSGSPNGLPANSEKPFDGLQLKTTGLRAPEEVYNMAQLSWIDICKRIEPQRRLFQKFSSTMQCCRITSGHCGDIDKVRFVSDSWLLTGCRDRTVLLWNVDAVRNLTSTENSFRINLSHAVASATAAMQPPAVAPVMNADPNHDDGIGNPGAINDAAVAVPSTSIPAFSVPTFNLNSANAPDDGRFYQRVSYHAGWVWTLDSCDNYVSSGGFDNEIHVVDLNALSPSDQCSSSSKPKTGISNFAVPTFKFFSPAFVYCHIWNKVAARASILVAGCHDNSLRFYDARHGEQAYQTDRLGGSTANPTRVPPNVDDTQIFSLFQESEHKLVASTRRAFYWFDMRMRRSIAEHTIRINRTQLDYARAMYFSDGICFIGSVKGQIFATSRELSYEPQWVSSTSRTTPAPLRAISDIHHDLGHVMTVQADSVRFCQPTLKPAPPLPVLSELSFRRFPNSDCKPLGCTFSELSGTTAIAATDNTVLLYWPMSQWNNVGVNW